MGRSFDEAGGINYNYNEEWKAISNATQQEKYLTERTKQAFDKGLRIKTRSPQGTQGRGESHPTESIPRGLPLKALPEFPNYAKTKEVIQPLPLDITSKAGDIFHNNIDKVNDYIAHEYKHITTQQYSNIVILAIASQTERADKSPSDTPKKAICTDITGRHRQGSAKRSPAIPLKRITRTDKGKTA